jgi:hypothetical protein
MHHKGVLVLQEQVLAFLDFRSFLYFYRGMKVPILLSNLIGQLPVVATARGDELSQ